VRPWIEVEVEVCMARRPLAKQVGAKSDAHTRSMSSRNPKPTPTIDFCHTRERSSRERESQRLTCSHFLLLLAALVFGQVSKSGKSRVFVHSF
jgi:hypothetical protein